jgi:multiple sugar transport system permease protein
MSINDPAIAQFFDADEAPWNYMMATAILYALPPVAIFFALRTHPRILSRR